MVDDRAQPIRVDVRVSDGLAGFDVAGMHISALREVRDRVRAGVLTSGLRWPARAITVMVAPAVRRSRSRVALDLPLAMGVLAADGQVPADHVNGRAFIGELALDGTIQSVGNTRELVSAVPTEEVVVPVASLREARAARSETGIRVRAHYNLRTLLAGLGPEDRSHRAWGRERRGPGRWPDPGEVVGDRYVSTVSGDVIEALGHGRYAVVDGPHAVPSQLPLGTIITAGPLGDRWRPAGASSEGYEVPEPVARQSATDLPYLRPASEDPVPEGWIAERTLLPWEGQETEVIYDPRRYQVAIDWDPGDDIVERALQRTGWEQHAVDGRHSLWIRDRLATSRAALASRGQRRPERGAMRAAQQVDPEIPPAHELGL